MISNPQNKSIAIICAPRTGSTAVSDCLAKQYNLTNFEEAFHPAWPQSAIELSKNNKFLFNLKYDQLNKSNFNQIMNLYNQSFCVRLRRRDVVKQIASNYLMVQTKIPHYRKQPPQSVYNKVNNQIDMDIDVLHHCIRTIKHCNHGLDTWPHPIDVDLFYEDLDLNSSSLYIYPKPSNYSLLVDTITKLM
jgi:LPS sulfotransferase NodH